MSSKNDDSMKMDVENHLDDFFSDEGHVEQPSKEEPKSIESKPSVKVEESSKATNKSFSDEDLQGHPIKELNAIVLEMDWEITEDIMTRFLNEVEKLKAENKSNKFIYSLLEILTSAGKYIRLQKVDSHPKSIKLLQTSYESLEKLLTTPKLSGNEKKTIVSNEIKKLKELQKVIRSNTGKASPEKEKPKAAKGKIEAIASDVVTKKDLQAAVKDLKKWFRAELIKQIG